MKEIIGDLFDPSHNFYVILHGCNCFHTMGAGVAKIVAMKYPEAVLADNNTNFGDRTNLGSISYFEIPKEENIYHPIIINCYTQFEPGATFEQDALKKCLTIVKNVFCDKKIGLPRIGCGIGGGDWRYVKKIIEESLKGCDYTVVSL